MNQTSSTTMAIADLREPAACGLIAIDYPCASCGYNLRQLHTSGCCPECGSEISATTDIVFFPPITDGSREDADKLRKNIKRSIILGVVTLVAMLLSSSAAVVILANENALRAMAISLLAIPTIVAIVALHALMQTVHITNKLLGGSIKMSLGYKIYGLFGVEILCFIGILFSLPYEGAWFTYLPAPISVATCTVVFFSSGKLRQVKRKYRIWQKSRRQKIATYIFRIILITASIATAATMQPNPENWMIVVSLCQILPFNIAMAPFFDISPQYWKAAAEFNKAMDAAMAGDPPPSEQAGYYKIMLRK